MTKLDKGIINELENIVKDAGLDPLPVEWIHTSNDSLAEDLQGILPIDIQYWEDGYMYFNQQSNSRDWTSQKVYGVLEVIYDYGDHAVGFIREDMPLGTQANVVLHAYAHADFMKNHKLKLLYKDVISSYVGSVNKYRKTLEEYETKYGLDFIEAVEDLSELLSDVTGFFKYEDIFPTKFDIEPQEKWDPEKEVFVIDDPDYPSKDSQDLIHSLMSIPWMSKPIKEILGIFRHRKMYTYGIKRTKIVDEGWASYWDSTLYSKAANHLGIKDFLLDNPYPKIPPLKYYKKNSGVYLRFYDIVVWLYSVLNNPYYLGFSFWKSKKDEGLDIFKYAHSITNNEIFENFGLKDLIRTMNRVLPFNLDIAYIKDNKYFTDLVDFIKKYGLSRTYTSYIPQGGITKKSLSINIVDRPYYQWDFEPNKDPIEIGENTFLISDIPIHIESDLSFKVDEFKETAESLIKKVLNVDEIKLSLFNNKIEDTLEDIGYPL